MSQPTSATEIIPDIFAPDPLKAAQFEAYVRDFGTLSIWCPCSGCVNRTNWEDLREHAIASSVRRAKSPEDPQHTTYVHLDPDAVSAYRGT